MKRLLPLFIFVFGLLSFCSQAQQAQQYLPNQEVRVNGFQPAEARAHDALSVLAASLATLIQNKDVCCGKNSALEDAVAALDPHALKDAAAKLNGRHLLSDGRPFTVTAQFYPGDAINSGILIQSLHSNQPMLLQWDSHTYVLYGAAYDETTDQFANLNYSIRSLQLWDLRYTDYRRKATFNRQTDDPAKLQGLMTISVALP